MIEKSNIMVHDWVDCGNNGNPEYAIVRKITGLKVRLSNGKQYNLSDINGIPLTIDNLILNGYIQKEGMIYNPDKSRFPVFYLKNGSLEGNRVLGKFIHNVQHQMRASGLICASCLWRVEEDNNDYQQTRLTEELLVNSGLILGTDKKGRKIFYANKNDNWWIIHNAGNVSYTLAYNGDYLSCWHVERLQQYFDVLGIKITICKEVAKTQHIQIYRQSNNLTAIETEYHGYKFRSRLEARWAVFFDQIGIKWEYEPQGYELGDGLRYLPDFRIENVLIDNDIIETLFIEIKGKMREGDVEKIRLMSKYNHILVLGDIPDYNNVRKDVTKYWDDFYQFSLFPIFNNSPAFVYPTYDPSGRLRLKSYWVECDEKKTKEAFKIARQARFEFGMTPTY